MLSDGAKFLSLAVPLGDYQPSGAAAARLRTMIASAGTRARDGMRIALDGERGAAARSRKPVGAGPRARAPRR